MIHQIISQKNNYPVQSIILRHIKRHLTHMTTTKKFAMLTATLLIARPSAGVRYNHLLFIQFSLSMLNMFIRLIIKIALAMMLLMKMMLFRIKKHLDVFLLAVDLQNLVVETTVAEAWFWYIYIYIFFLFQIAKQTVKPQDQRAMILASLVVTASSSFSMERAKSTSA